MRATVRRLSSTRSPHWKWQKCWMDVPITFCWKRGKVYLICQYRWQIMGGLVTIDPYCQYNGWIYCSIRKQSRSIWTFLISILKLSNCGLGKLYGKVSFYHLKHSSDFRMCVVKKKPFSRLRMELLYAVGWDTSLYSFYSGLLLHLIYIFITISIIHGMGISLYRFCSIAPALPLSGWPEIIQQVVVHNVPCGYKLRLCIT